MAATGELTREARRVRAHHEQARRAHVSWVTTAAALVLLVIFALAMRQLWPPRALDQIQDLQ